MVTKKRTMTRRLITFVTICSLWWCLSPHLADAVITGDKDNRPARAITVAVQYSGMLVPKGDTVRVDLVVNNTGRADETVLLDLPQPPKGWKISFKGANYAVTSVFVPGGKSETLALTAEPDKDTGAGDYTFLIKGRTKDGALTSETSLTIMVTDQAITSRDITITTSYPELSGPTSTNFEFSLEVSNKSGQDRIFNLSATGPEKWEFSFKPAYEAKQISSLRIKAGSSQAVAVEVKPDKQAKLGTFPVNVEVNSGQSKAEAQVRVIITGTYEIKAGTPSGLLSLSAQPGKPSNLSIYVKNTGSAVQKGVSFVSFKPENWKVEFKPEKIDAIPPNDMKQVEVNITPGDEALVGDYSVAVTAQGEKATSDVELRVTVKASTIWGWIGLLLILAVVLGLALVFRYAGRR
ncbi:MAG: hypothetical protein HQK56_05620 [Deltaproteobacteria bacterium]|nr:hypothetical protein [Deltaproteobacteria bacterium]